MKLSHGNEILFVSLMVLLFAPPQYKLPGLLTLCLFLVVAAVIDWKKNRKRVRRLSRLASCSCEKAREKISFIYVPQLVQVDCTVCGAEAS